MPSGEPRTQREVIGDFAKAVRTTFGLEPTPWEEVVAATVLAKAGG